VADGWVFDIQRFSTHDGPGIRTTVFFKGCGLRCLWCHNPESWVATPQVLNYGELCIDCGRCKEACPTGARDDDGYKPEICTACGECAEACPSEAIRLSGKRMTTDQVVADVLRDKAFYETSGGGITLSGGEPLLQPEFAAAILKQSRNEGLHTAIETAAHVSWSALEAVLPHTNLVLLDIKLMDSDRHHKATGKGNELILANAQRLGELAVPMVVRMPIIPGINDNEDDVRDVARFAKTLPNVQGIELMRFHALASHKARSLGIEDWGQTKDSPTVQKMTGLVAVASEQGLEARIG